MGGSSPWVGRRRPIQGAARRESPFLIFVPAFFLAPLVLQILSFNHDQKPNSCYQSEKAQQSEREATWRRLSNRPFRSTTEEVSLASLNNGPNPSPSPTNYTSEPSRIIDADSSILSELMKSEKPQMWDRL